MALVAGNPHLNVLRVVVGKMLAPSLTWAEIRHRVRGEQAVRGRSRGEQSRGTGDFWKESKRRGLELNTLWAVGTGEELRADREETKRAQKERTGRGQSTNRGCGGGKVQKKASRA